MYSTSIKNNRYQIQCLAVSDKIRSAKFVIDTGAKFISAEMQMIIVKISICTRYKYN